MRGSCLSTHVHTNTDPPLRPGLCFTFTFTLHLKAQIQYDVQTGRYTLQLSSFLEEHRRRTEKACFDEGLTRPRRVY